jgi:demethylmenaquinone methyltransferase / 2-methoxy-6-polyprenyl-1,4-benzoquinol methylase
MNDNRSNGAPRLGALDVDAYLADPLRKQAFVTPMFDVIAPRYDAFTRLFSLGMDRRWKAAAIEAAKATAAAPTQLLDLASGTGDLAVALARVWPTALIDALDASPRMIEAAHTRLTGCDADVAPRVTPMVGDMMALPQPSASVDVVTASYGVRNVPVAEVAVREMARVVRPGGMLVTLDFYRPTATWWRVLFLGYLQWAGNLVGWWWHRDPVVYGYIARSIDHFMSADAFRSLLEREGFLVMQERRYLLGGIAIHVARRTDRVSGS